MKILKIVVGILFFTLSFLFFLSVLGQSLSAELMGLVISSTVILLWGVIPTVVAILSLLMVGYSNDKFIHLLYVMITLLLISNMTFLLFINIAEMGFGIIFLVLFVWGSTFWFVVVLFVKLLDSYFFEKNIKEIIESILKVKIIKSILLSATVTFLLFQIYLLGNAISVYKAVKVLNIEEKKEYSLFYFYRPFVYEIRLADGRRWSYGRVKFVNETE
ncbi:MAG: Unknown protein [uncultured Sulfurovum sp.]|uniref:Uncharacterized protein n=1 Tax=uncultured Sulfurovum sp. TaxID=269237 RepID=A0A6S6SXJ6_9BACT|nr:MAG: Unknown protein [uncultured Sulfurovum sp.]